MAEPGAIRLETMCVGHEPLRDQRQLGGEVLDVD
jgi:hypothetical protein